MHLIFLFLSAALATSFDCTKATLENERLICTTPALAELDAYLDDLYKGEKVHLSPELRKTLLQEQQSWLKVRDQTCTTMTDGTHKEESISCLTYMYKMRIEFFEHHGVFQPCDTCEGNDYYTFKNMDQARKARFKSYLILSDYVSRYEAKFGAGSAIKIVQATLKEMESVDRRTQEICGTFSSGQFGREGRSFHDPLCQVSQWEDYGVYLQTQVFKQVPTVQ